MSDTIKLFNCDLNWTYYDKPIECCPPSSAHDWAYIDPEEYYNWHMDFGTNVMYCQAYPFSGYALYPTKLGPVAPGPGVDLFPRLFELANRDNVPTWSYFCVGCDIFTAHTHSEWMVPGCLDAASWGFLAPESPWTDLLCARIREFLQSYPVDWLLLDWFVYGALKTNDFKVRPAWFVREPFEEIIGRTMPDSEDEITDAESMKYKREVLSRQFYAIKAAVKETSPNTKIIFNVPYWEPHEEIWEGHPMMTESDGLFAESSDESIVNWLLTVRRPEQRVMTTIIGRLDGGCEICDPNSWEKWHKQDCDFFGYAWGTPPDFRPHPRYNRELEIVRMAFQQIQ